MRRLLPLLLLANAEAPPAAVEAVPIPDPIRAMLQAAMDGGNDGEVSTIVKFARAADPASGDAVLQIAEAWRTRRATERNNAIAAAGPLQLWKGRAEVGGYLTTGNSDTKGGSAILDVQREGLRWRHKLRLQADYQEALGVTNREHYLAAYEPNLKIDARRYLYGAAQFESDRFLGYDERYSVSAGAGYSAVQTPRVTLNLELGPAYRYTDFTDGTLQSSLAGRGSLDFAWKLTGGLTLNQDASAYVQRYNSTVSSSTALAAKLIGPLSAQLSYVVQYESEPPVGRRNTDTTSRASLVYSF